MFPFQIKESLSFLFIIISLISFFVSNLLQFSYVNILYFLEKMIFPVKIVAPGGSVP